MTSKLEEPGRKAAIINKTKEEDVGTSPGVFARADQKDEAWRRAEVLANKKRPGPLRGPLSGGERARERRDGTKRLLAPQTQDTKGDKISDKSSDTSFPPVANTPPPAASRKEKEIKAKRITYSQDRGAAERWVPRWLLLRNCLEAI